MDSTPELVNLLHDMAALLPSQRPSFADVLARLVELRDTTSEEVMKEPVPSVDREPWASHIKEEK
jgi:hypothetical protein